MSTIGYESRTSVVYRSEYHDHTNIVSVIGCPRAKQVHWLPDPVLSPLLMGAAQAESLHVQLREEALGRCCHSINATVHGEFGGASQTTRGARRRVGGESPAALVMELRPLAEMIPRTASRW